MASYINADSKESNGCTPAGFSAFGTNLYTGVKTAGACNNKIMLSISNNAAASFTGTTTDPRSLPTVNTAPSQLHTDQWFQWQGFDAHGMFAVSYYDRQYGTDETSGNMDVSVSGTNNLTSFNVHRATSASMPLPTQFPDAEGNSLFFGDYAGVAVISGKAYPAWSDTRDSDVVLCPGTAAPGVPPAVCKMVEPNGLTATAQEIFATNISLP